MITKSLGRKLKTWVMSGSLAAALAANAAGQEGRGVLIDNPVPQGHGWVNPQRSEVGQGDGRFGPVRTRREESGNLTVRNHNGLDLSAPVGTPVRSPVSGIVIRSVPNWRGENANGNEVRVLGEDGREYWFFHLSGESQPAIGERIEAGANVGEVGRTAIPRGAASHLHFEVRENGRPVPLESVGGDSRQGLFNYILSQPQTTSEEAEMIRNYLEEDRNYTPHPSAVPSSQPPTEPSIFDRVIDLLIPSAHGQSRPEGQAQAAQTLSVNESAAARQEPGAPSGGGRFEYDDSAEGVDGGETRRHIPRDQSIEADVPVHEGAQWLFEDHREGAAPPANGQSTNPSDILNLPAPQEDNSGSGGAMNPEPMRMDSPQIVSPEQMTAPSPAPRPTPGMTQEDFRSSMEQSMEEFQRADEFNRQNPLRIPQESGRPNDDQPRDDQQLADSPSTAPRSQNAPRQQDARPPRTERSSQETYSTGDFLEGYQPQPQMSQPQEPQRRNRVYWDGGSRPIGSQTDGTYQQYRQMQNWSNQQIEQMNRRRQERSPGGRYYDYGASPSPSATPAPNSSNFVPNSSSSDYRPTYSIGFDDDAPRGGRSRFGYDETPGTANRMSEPARAFEMPELPSGRSAVESRTSGATASTAALRGP